MRFFQIFKRKSVPEWQQCYYDYTDVKSLIILCKKAYAIRSNIQDMTAEDSYSFQDDINLIDNKQALQNIKIVYVDKIQTIVQDSNILFFQYHQINKVVVNTFIQFKIHQLNDRVQNYNIWYQHLNQTKSLIKDLLSNCYAQKLKLQIMAQLHVEAFQKLHKKHLKAITPFGLTTLQLKSPKLERNIISLQKFHNKLNTVIEQHREIIHIQQRYRLQQQLQISHFKLSMLSYFFGLFNGFSICLLITSFVLLGVNIGTGELLTQNQTKYQVMFTNQFRLWKGTGFIILYLWVFGISMYIFQKKRINYNLIFGYTQSNYEVSSVNLTSSTFYLFVWCCFFIFYIMDLLQIYPAAKVQQNPNQPITIFFPAIIYGLFILGFIIEFIRKPKGVLFLLTTLVKIILSLFGCFSISFAVIWATQQIISLVQLIFSLSYSICYYNVLLKTPYSLNNPCLNLKIIPECLAIFIYSIRLFQCLKISHGRGKFLGTGEMYIIIRAIVYITLAGLSLVARKQNYIILGLWGFIGFFSAIYATFIDVLLDWNLFSLKNKKIIRRQYNIFSIKIINFMVFVSFFYRFSFLFTFCPNIIFIYLPNPEIAISIASFFQLGRRLIWNLFKLQNEQITNNYHFQIRLDYNTKQKKMIDELITKQQHTLIKNRLPVLRSQNQISFLRELIRQKEKIRQKVRQFQKKNNQILQQIEEAAQKQIFNLLGVLK